MSFQERNDEESPSCLGFLPEEFLAALGMTASNAFFNKLLDGGGDLTAEEVESEAEAFLEVDFRLPVEQAAGLGDVRATLPGVVLRKRLEDDLDIRAKQGANALGEFENGDFLRVAEIDRFVLVGLRQAVNPFNQIGDVAEAAGLLAIAVDGDGLAGECLMDEIGEGAAVVEAHARAVGIEDADDVRIDGVGAVVGHGHGLGEALGFVVHAARADGVDVAPVGFGLRVDFRVAVTFGGGGEQISCFLGRARPRVLWVPREPTFRVWMGNLM